MRAKFLPLFVLPALLSLNACRENAAGPPGGPPGANLPPPEVSIITVEPESLTITTELPGRVSAVRVAEVRARVPGILLKKTFREGADVKAGDVMFQIDPAPLQAAVNNAKATRERVEANLHLARTQAERLKKLVSGNAVSRQEYDAAVAQVKVNEAELNAAQAALETAELNLGYATVTAPISGRTGRAAVTEGALVGQNEPTLLATVHQMDPVYFDFTQSSAELLRLKREMAEGRLKSVDENAVEVRLTLEDGTPYPHPGKLLFSDLAVNESTGMITLRAEFPNPDRVLLPGMFARGRLEQAVRLQAIAVPQRAVTRSAAGAATVMIVNAENKVEVRRVQADAAVGDRWVISSGLQGGERVIMEGLQKVRPGAPVVPVPFVDSSSAAAAPAKPAGAGG